MAFSIIYQYRIDMDVLIALMAGIIFAAIYFYISSRMYLNDGFMTSEESAKTYETPEAGAEAETLKSFQEKVRKGDAGQGPVIYDQSDYLKPYMTDEDKYGDYELDFIFNQEGGYNPTRDAINAARGRFPFDWANLPPSANQFQMQQALFEKAGAAPYSAETFKNIEARDLLPTDSLAEEERQAKILSSYKPVSAADMQAPTVQSVEELAKQIYEPRGLIPIVKQQGATNVYEIYETKEINPKIVYEDEVSRGNANPLEPLSPDVSKYVSMPTDTSLGLAPLSQKEKTGKNSYSTYDPSLEAMFGPRMSWQQWG